MRKFLKWAGIAVLCPVVLFLMLVILLYIPPVQDWAVKKVVAFASEKTGMQVAVGAVRLSFPLDLSVEDLKIFRPGSGTSENDTVALAGQLLVDVRLCPLFRKQVEIDELKFSQLHLNTLDLIDVVQISGKIGAFCMQSHGIDFSKELVKLDFAELTDAKIKVVLNDSVPQDTTTSENRWRIQLERLHLKNSAVALNLFSDSLQLQAVLGDAMAQNGYFDLGKSVYRVEKFDLKGSSLLYDQVFEPHIAGFDYNHLSLSELSLAVDSVNYRDPKLDMMVRRCLFKEKSGLAVREISGRLSLDDQKIHVPDLKIHTSESSLAAALNVDLSSLSDKSPGKSHVRLNASLGKQDILRLMGGAPQDFNKNWPNQPLVVNGLINGNVHRVDFERLNVNIPNRLRAQATGFVINPLDAERMIVDVDFLVQGQDVQFAKSFLDASLQKQINIPKNIALGGKVRKVGHSLAADFRMHDGNGFLEGKGQMDTHDMAYDIKLEAREVAIRHFMPSLNASPLSGTVYLRGQGTDFLSPKSSLEATADIKSFTYEGYDLSGMTISAMMDKGVAKAEINSGNSLLDGKVTLHGLTNSKRLKGTLSTDVRTIDFHRLNLVDRPMSAAVCAHVDFETDMKGFYHFEGILSDITLNDNGAFHRSKENVEFNLLSTPDTTFLLAQSNDFSLNFNGKGGYERLLDQVYALTDEVTRQLKEKNIDQLVLRKKLPAAHLHFFSGKDNIVCDVLKKYGYGLERAYIDLASSPLDGVNGNVYFNTLTVDSMRIDTVKLVIMSDANQTNFKAQVCNNKNNPQYVFNALFDGGIHEKGAFTNTKIYDSDNRLGVDLGVSALMEEDGLRLRLQGTNPVLGYKTFSANDDNYIFLGDDKHVSAFMRLVAADGTGVQVYSDDGSSAQQDITLSLNRFDLTEIMSVIPYTPDISGIMNGDFHFIQTDDAISVSSSITIDDFFYEKSPMGDLGSELVYMPKDDGSHYVDGIFYQNQREICTLTGTYQAKGRGYLDAVMHLDRTPMGLLNGFVPDKILGFKGYAEGDLTLKGEMLKPQINGEILLDSAYMFSEPYGIELRFDNDPVRIQKSKLLFENFEVYSHNETPLTLAGFLDMSDLEKMKLDLRMQTRNFLLVDAKENHRSETYGKVFVNFFGRMNGLVSNLKMRGKLDVLGNTDVVYVLRDSPLTTDTQLDDLVKFTNFSDTTLQHVVTRPPLSGFDMDLSVGIDQGARIKCELNAEHTNYVDLQGGGELRMKYTSADNLRLNGRYTLNNGEMKYSLPIIPLKTFTIQDGSYIEFTGEPMNPTLNITATEQTKASVSSGGENGRMVAFNCGVVITKTLNDMGLEFIIDAPEDITVHSQLASMTPEERGKIAVTMLTTGMFLADGNTNNFTMNTALSAFLQNQINAISGNALRTLDLSFGMDNATDMTGRIHTDYSFKFAKRFWDNRLRIVIGGKVSSGSDAYRKNDSFFENVTFEYRLNQQSNKYMKVFYDREGYDWLEGDIAKYGVGFIWKRKLQHFKDIFKFKSEKPVMRQRQTSQRNDSITIKP